MIPNTNIPDGWTEIDTEFTQQEQAFQRRRDGLVASIEKGTTHRKRWSAVTLPQNFMDDNQVIDTIEASDDRDEVEQAALNWMRDNNRQ